MTRTMRALIWTALLLPVVGLADSAHTKADRRPPGRRTYGIAAVLAKYKQRAPKVVAARMRARGLTAAARFTARVPDLSLDYDQELAFPLTTQEVVAVTVPIPLGGRLARRRDAALSRARLARTAADRKVVTTAVSFAKRYFELLRLQRLLVLQRQSFAEHADIAKRIAAREQGGGIAGVVSMRLALEVRRRQFAQERLRERLAKLGRRLALTIGVTDAPLVANGPLLPPSPPPALASLQKRLRHSGALRYLQADLSARRAQLRLAQALRWPDLKLSVGYLRQQSPAPDRRIAHGMVIGLSVPLPLASGGRQAVTRAEHRIRLTNWRIKRHGIVSLVLLKDAHRRAARARLRCERYRRKVLAGLPQLLRGVRVAFDGGGAISAILESLALVAKARRDALDLALEARRASLEIHGLVGTLPRS